MINVEKFEQFIKERSKFSSETFGTPEERDCMGPLYHLKEEIDELIENPNDTSEWADCLLLLLDAGWRKGYTFDDLVEFAMAKLEVNKKRKWKKAENGVYNHVKEESKQMNYTKWHCKRCDAYFNDEGGKPLRCNCTESPSPWEFETHFFKA